MRSPATTPRLVPEFDLAMHIVLDDFATAGRVYRETDEERARLDTVIDDFSPASSLGRCAVVFNTTEGWSRGVSEDVAWKVLGHAIEERRTLPATTRIFVEFVEEDEILLTIFGGAFAYWQGSSPKKRGTKYPLRKPRIAHALRFSTASPARSRSANCCAANLR